MADYAAIRSGLKTRLATSSTFIQVAATVPDTVSVPAAIVQPGSPVAEYHQAFGNGLERFTVQDPGVGAAVRRGSEPDAPRRVPVRVPGRSRRSSRAT
jgi:hypothetical protein